MLIIQFEFTHTPANVVPLGHCTAGVAAKHKSKSVTLAPPPILEPAWTLD